MDSQPHTASHEPHGGHHVNYLLVFGTLCVLTALSWMADESAEWGIFDSKAVIVVLVLAIAVAKALCVMMFFMHLKFEGRWKYVLLAPTAILACGLLIALAPDIGLHYYTVDVPQVRNVSTHSADDAAPHDSAPVEHAEH